MSVTDHTRAWNLPLPASSEMGLPSELHNLFGESQVTFRSRIFSLFLVLLAGVFMAGAQSSNGTIVGVITDSSGGALVGATVTITSTDTGAVRTTVTNSEGTFRIESVLPGNYDVSASATGFQTTVHKGLQVPGTTIVTASLVLQVGSAVDKVEVSADNAVLNTDNGQLSGTIGEEEIHTCPSPALIPTSSRSPCPV